MKSWRALQERDWRAGVEYALRCVAAADFETTPLARNAQDSCLDSLRHAYANGYGVAKDEAKALVILREEVRRDPTGFLALDLARRYLDGDRVARDPVEAAVLVWAVAHGRWSFYGPNFGGCKDGCKEAWEQQRELERRLASTLTPSEQARAEELAKSRFPALVQQKDHRDGQFQAFAVLAGTILLGWIISRAILAR